MSFRYSSSVESVGNSNEPDIVYYNADIIADAYDVKDVLNGVDKDPPIRFQETRSVPLISDISKYMFSIIRFTMDGAGKDLPIFIPNINDTQPDVNLTTYAITYEYTVYYVNPTTATNESKLFTAQRFVYYRPETIGAPIPNAPNAVASNGEFCGQDLRGRYYFVYTYGHWVDLVNEAFQSAWNGAELAVPDTYHPTKSIEAQWSAYWLTLGGTTLNQPILQGSPPVLRYNPSTYRFSLFGNSYCCGNVIQYNTTIPSNNPANYVSPLPTQAWSYGASPSYATNLLRGTELMNVWFNTDMFGMFANFRNIFLGNESSGRTNLILFIPNGNNYSKFENLNTCVQTPADAPAIGTSPIVYIEAEQEYESTSTLWSPISSIVFSSTMIPIFPEQTGTPLTYGEGNNNIPTESTSNFTPIITDISVPMTRADDYRGFLSYTPTGEYRLSSFTGSRTELRNIDIQVFWKNRINNTLYPITMFNLSSVSIKMMFRKK